MVKNSAVRVALYEQDWPLGKTPEFYTPVGEAHGTGYEPGGTDVIVVGEWPEATPSQPEHHFAGWWLLIRRCRPWWLRDTLVRVCERYLCPRHYYTLPYRPGASITACRALYYETATGKTLFAREFGTSYSCSSGTFRVIATPLSNEWGLKGP